ncbi:MAG: hypothetical protein EZS28_003095 [Streblomastix strix]|uniref:Uncharacterized protein n=1 Tax=Streblomastix strix TaxID=222440 RepID=A0A5J4X2C9_9EUKA|nr:MAG: hypothetical protein EZS28_003095 [Streblomastix strix]
MPFSICTSYPQMSGGGVVRRIFALHSSVGIVQGEMTLYEGNLSQSASVEVMQFKPDPNREKHIFIGLVQFTDNQLTRT